MELLPQQKRHPSRDNTHCSFFFPPAFIIGLIVAFHRMTEWWGLEGTSVGHPVQPPAQAGSPTAGCTAPRPGGAGISPEKETPQPPWAAWARAPSPSEGRSSYIARSLGMQEYKLQY